MLAYELSKIANNHKEHPHANVKSAGRDVLGCTARSKHKDYTI